VGAGPVAETIDVQNTWPPQESWNRLRRGGLYECLEAVAEDGAVPASRGQSAQVPDNSAAAVALDVESRRLFQLAFLLCGDRRRAEDAVAEAVARVWRRGLGKPIEDVRPYLRRTLVNLLARQHHRRASEAAALVRHGPGGDVPEVSAEALDHVAVETALLRLPMNQRTIVVLRYFEDMSEAEIASTLRVARGTVKSRAARALEALRPLLEGD
jgi:RNA polymerase sigma factor (sigma-70 family)